jgi:hypothetical protein
VLALVSLVLALVSLVLALAAAAGFVGVVILVGSSKGTLPTSWRCCHPPYRVLV